MMILTSGGCNALEYAIHGPKRIHAVDMNKFQGHMLELKIAGITSLPYEDFWTLFGQGFHPEFEWLLDTRMSPFLSAGAFSHWKQNASFDNIFKTGGSGKAIRAFAWLVYFRGLQEPLERLLTANTIPE